MVDRNYHGSATTPLSDGNRRTIRCFASRATAETSGNGEPRPADAHTAAGILDLLRPCFAKIPASVRSVIVRANKGFYDHGLVEWLEAGKAAFVVLAHLRYTSPSCSVQVAEFRSQPTRWRRGYRFVVIRRPQSEEPTEQLTLFKLSRYHDQVLVTNLPFQPLNLWRFLQ